MDTQSAINTINWTSPSWDLFVIVIFVAGIFLCSLGLGKDKTFVILVSSYISLALVSKLSLIQEILGFQLGGSFVNDSAVFLGGTLFLFFVLSNSAFTSVFDQGLDKAWFQTAVISFLQIGLMISIIVSFLTPEEAAGLSDFMKSFFADNQAQFIWLISPIVAITILKK